MSKLHNHKWLVIGFLPGDSGLPALVFIECIRRGCCEKFTAEIVS